MMFSLCSSWARFKREVIFMGAEIFPGICFHRLAAPGDASGVSCDENGPAIGPIRLLTKTASGFRPRSVDELTGFSAMSSSARSIAPILSKN